MPSESIKQREAIAIAEHHPNELYARNRGLLNLTHQQMHDYAATKEKGLLLHVPKAPRVPKIGRKYYGE